MFWSRNQVEELVPTMWRRAENWRGLKYRKGRELEWKITCWIFLKFLALIPSEDFFHVCHRLGPMESKTLYHGCPLKPQVIYKMSIIPGLIVKCCDLSRYWVELESDILQCPSTNMILVKIKEDYPCECTLHSAL